MQRGGSSAKEAREERRRKRKERQGALQQTNVPADAPKEPAMPTDAQIFEGRIVTVLAVLFVLSIAEGLAVAASVRTAACNVRA